jgi:hypothetical protein
MKNKRICVKFPTHLPERELLRILMSELASTRARIMLIEAMLCKTSGLTEDEINQSLSSCRELSFGELNSALKAR